MNVHVCMTSDLHPYECNGPEHCVHCRKEPTAGHIPSLCWLCYDGEPPGHAIFDYASRVVAESSEGGGA